VKTAHRFHRPLVLSSALLLQLACGSDGKDGALDGIPPSLQLLSSNVLGALCENQLECPIAYDDQLYTAAFFVQRPGGDATDNCLAYYATAKTTQRLSRVQQAQERGTVEVDRAQLDRLSSCQVPTEDDSWLVGKVAVRSACQLHAECQGGYCDTSASCPGTCVARLPVGATCSTGTQCLSDACDLVCVERTVTTNAGEGEACGVLGSREVLCARGLWCDDEDTGVCRQPIAAGQDCTDDDDVCIAGHVCAPLGPLGEEEDPPMRCVPLLVQPEGAACDMDGASGASFRICDLVEVDGCVNGTCVHYPEGAAGDPCHRTDMADTCGAGLACEWGDWVCVPLLEEGEPCSGSGECKGQCNARTRRCEPSEPYCDEPLLRAQ
jgi:hypothetical protein